MLLIKKIMISKYNPYFKLTYCGIKGVYKRKSREVTPGFDQLIKSSQVFLLKTFVVLVSCSVQFKDLSFQSFWLNQTHLSLHNCDLPNVLDHRAY
jgi:hypothetical protein